MNRTIPRLLALLVTVACVSAACGGKVVFDTTSSPSGAGGGSGGSTGAGGCDAASHTLDGTAFNVSCNVASDCSPAFFGDFCSACRCPGSAINVADTTKYQAEAPAKGAGTPPAGCFCPAAVPICAQGQCAVELP